MARTFTLSLLLAVSTIAFAATDSIDAPAGAGSAVPYLAAGPNGSIVMAWTEGQALRFARLSNGKWSEPRTIASGPSIASNWANAPVIAASDQALLAVWLQTAEGGHHNVDAYVSASRDGGTTWSKPRVLHPNTKSSEYGFASVVPLRDGFGVLWLDGRNVKSEMEGGTTLRYAQVGLDGSVGKDAVLDDRVCECCGTGMTIGARGPLAVYRDREAGDIRDIAYVSRAGDSWSKPRPVHRDGWQIKGCPVNGPQVDAAGNSAAVAWFTAAEGKPRVEVAFSRDGGATFGNATRVDEGKPAGRVDVQMLRDGAALVTWIEGSGDAAGVVARRVSENGTTGPVMRIATTGAARGVGSPRAVVSGDKLYVAWTEPGKRVRVAAIELR